MRTHVPAFERGTRYLLAGAFVSLAALVRWLMPGALSGTPYLAFYPAVVAAAAFGGFGPGTLATIATFLCVDIVFDDTPGWINIGDPVVLGRMVIYFAGGIGISVVAEMRRAAAARVKIAKEAAEAANIAKSQFLASMSHELRTPMTAILGMTDLALKASLPDRVRERLQTARESAGLLLELLNQVLDLSSIETGRLQLQAAPFSLRQAVEQAVRTLRVQADEKGLALVCELAADIPDHLVGDHLRLRQVLMNLIGNAIKFTPHGQVAVRAAVHEHTVGSVEVQFSVSDTGIGLAPEDQERIFTPFTQADASTARRYGGSGVGLATARKLIELMGGKLWLESQLGHGSTFHFTVTLAEAAPALAASQDAVGSTAGRQTPSPDALPLGPAGTDDRGASRVGIDGPLARSTALPVRPLRVLLAEDTLPNQMLVRCVLGERGHGLVVAQNGREALERLAAEDFDVVLMDVGMPEMDGFQATAAIRALPESRKARLPIIALTAHAMNGDAERCLASGMDAYLSKPIDEQALIILVERLAAGRDPADASRRPRPQAAARPLLADEPDRGEAA